MSLIDEVDDLLLDDVVVKTQATDGFGAASGSPATVGTFKARVKGGQSITVVKDGQELKATTTALFERAATGLTVDHLYELPARYSPRSPQAVDVSIVSDDEGVDHCKVFFK